MMLVLAEQLDLMVRFQKDPGSFGTTRGAQSRTTFPQYLVREHLQA